MVFLNKASRKEATLPVVHKMRFCTGCTLQNSQIQPNPLFTRKCSIGTVEFTASFNSPH